jgi:hypothetical protein
MKIYSFQIILFLFLLLAGCVENPLPVQGGLVVVGSTVHEFSPSRQKEELYHVFVLTNEAEIPIYITGLKSSCGCTWAADKDSFVGSVLKPNDALDFPVFLNTGTSQSKAGGRILISYRHQTENPKLAFEGDLLLEVTTEILPDYRIEPLEIDFGDINGFDVQQVKTTFFVRPDQLKTLDIKEVKPSVDILTTKILSSKESCYEIEVGLDVSSFTENRAFRGHVVIETNSETLPKGIAQVNAQYIAPVNIQPSSIVISSDKEGTVNEEVLIFTSLPSQILCVDCGLSGLIRVEFDAAEKSDRHVLKFSVDPCQEKEIDEKIMLELSLLPSDGRNVKKSCPISIYRFKKEY